MSKFNPKNDVFKNWDKKIYIATKKDVTLDDYNNQIVNYNKPFYFGRENYQPMNWRDLQAFKSVYGEISNNIIGLLIDYKDKNKFKEFDLAYLYGANPNGEIVNGENANYIVKAFKPQNTKIMVVLEEIIKDNSQYEEPIEENNVEEEVING